MSEEKKIKYYYLNIECEIIHKINDCETLIKIALDILQYDCEDDEYYDKVYYHLIANNKYIFDKPCEVNEEIEKIEHIFKNKRDELTMKHKELIVKQGDEISKLETKKENLLKKYKQVKGIEKALDLMFGDYEYVVSAQWNNYKIFKKEDLSNDFEETDRSFQCIIEEGEINFSYNKHNYVPVKNYEEALKLLKNSMKFDKSSSYTNNRIYEACKKYNIQINGLSEYRKEKEKKEKEEIKKERKKLEKKLENLKKYPKTYKVR